MKLFTIFMTVLFIVSTSCAVTEYQWPGPLVIPSDGTKAIECTYIASYVSISYISFYFVAGSIHVQLPDNFTFVSRHIKVREGVEVTLDCSPIIKSLNPILLLEDLHQLLGR